MNSLDSNTLPKKPNLNKFYDITVVKILKAISSLKN